MNTTVTLPPRKKASFPVRRMDFSFNFVPKYWFNQDAGLTHFMTALSALFPEGEQFFVDSVRAVRHHDHIKMNKIMQAEISAFIGQEAMHSKEHEAFNHYAQIYGFDIEKMERWTRLVIDSKKMFHYFFPIEKIDMAATCALEHYTATIAAQLLKREDFHDMMQDPTMLKLWLWHAIEENEHKAVAYDVFEAIYGKDFATYFLRCFSMLVATILIFCTHSFFFAYLMHQDRKLRLKHIKQTLKIMYGRQGFFTQILPQLADYFRREFHPNDHDTENLLHLWKTTLKLST